MKKVFEIFDLRFSYEAFDYGLMIWSLVVPDGSLKMSGTSDYTIYTFSIERNVEESGYEEYCMDLMTDYGNEHDRDETWYHAK